MSFNKTFSSLPFSLPSRQTARSLNMCGCVVAVASGTRTLRASIPSVAPKGDPTEAVSIDPGAEPFATTSRANASLSCRVPLFLTAIASPYNGVAHNNFVWYMSTATDNVNINNSPAFGSRGAKINNLLSSRNTKETTPGGGLDSASMGRIQVIGDTSVHWNDRIILLCALSSSKTAWINTRNRITPKLWDQMNRSNSALPVGRMAMSTASLNSVCSNTWTSAVSLSTHTIQSRSEARNDPRGAMHNMPLPYGHIPFRPRISLFSLLSLLSLHNCNTLISNAAVTWCVMGSNVKQYNEPFATMYMVCLLYMAMVVPMIPSMEEDG